jgi:NAD(P)-dependent dehydrogenase (short-subunit alcohol dehydrogenase family)
MTLIFGASKGIGNYLYHQYVLKGEDVAGTRWNTHQSYLSPVDVADYSSVEYFVANLYQPQHLNVLVCAGIHDAEVLHKSDPAQWGQVLAINTLGAYNVARAVLPIMRKQEYGRIIFFSSVVAQRGGIGTSAYATSKAALWGLAKSITMENASKGITCNCLNLGYSAVGMGDELTPSYKANVLEEIPARRFCSKTEIGNAVDFLIHTPYVTGAGLDISGGFV